jgi:hypothetical protein
MEYALETETLTVGELLSGRFQLVLPDFQRAFSWDVTQAEHLLEDIDAARLDQDRSEERAPYFLGTMLFAEPGAGDPVREAQIIDGQQRITTLTVLFAVLRDLVDDPETRAALHRLIAVWSTDDEALGDQFHLTPRTVDRAFVARMVQKDGATQRRRRKNALAPERPSQERIARVRGFFLKRLGRERTAEERAALARFIIDQCSVLVMRTTNLDFAYQIFLTLNTRGLALTDDDIVAAEVIGPLSREQKARFEPIIAQLSRYRDQRDKAVPRGKTFFSHLVGLHGWGTHSMIAELRRAVVSNGGPLAFTRKVFQPMAEAFLLTRLAFEDRDVPPAVRQELEKLMLLERLCDDEWVPSAMIGLAALDLQDPKLVTFLRALDRFAHAQLAVKPIRSERRRRYRRANQQLRANLDRVGDVDAFALSENDQQKALTRVATDLCGTAGRLPKVILMRLDAAISGRPISAYLDFADDALPRDRRISVEHVVPCGVRLGAQSAWRTDFPDDLDRRNVSQYLGNLCLVGEQLNQKLAQKGWSEKREGYLNDDLSASFSLVQSLKGRDVWDRQAIAERHRHLMQTLADLFDLAGEIEEVPVEPTAGQTDAKPKKPVVSKASRVKRRGRRR